MGYSYKILVINWQDIRNPLGGGAEVHLHEIFKRLAAAGHRITLLCSRFKSAAEEEVIDGIRILRRGNRDLFNFYVPIEYRKLVKNGPFDIVIDDINKIPFYTPLFVKEPILAIAHHFFGKSIFLQVSPFYGAYVYLSEWMVRFIYRKIPFAAVSESTRLELKQWKIRGEIDIMPNAVDLSGYPRKSMTELKPVIGYLGRIKKYKSIDHLIRAIPLMLKRQPNLRVKIIGGGDHLKQLKRLADNLHVQDYVQFTGYVSHEDKVAHMQECSVIVNPSPKEGWGLTVLEANACGIPVVAADAPGLKDSVVNGVTGTLYPYGNLDALAEAVVELLEDRKKNESFSDHSRSWAEQWNWDHSARVTEALIKKRIEG